MESKWDWLVDLLQTYGDSVLEAEPELEYCDVFDLDSIDGISIGNFRVSTGAEKMVLVPKDESSNWVIKIIVNEGCQSYHEPYIYQEAENCGLGDYFARCWDETYMDLPYIGESMVYYQSRVQDDDNAGSELKYNDDSNPDSEEFVSSVTENTNLAGAYANALWVCYGEEIAKMVCDFLDEYGCGDFHTGNYSVFGGKCIAFDYAGYC